MDFKERIRLYITAFLVFVIVMTTVGGAAIASENRISDNTPEEGWVEPAPAEPEVPAMIPVEMPEEIIPAEPVPEESLPAEALPELLPAEEIGGIEAIPANSENAAGAAASVKASKASAFGEDEIDPVGDPPVSSVSINGKPEVSQEVVLGNTISLTVSVLPASANQTVSWSSADSTIATVSAGIVTGVKAGKVDIKAASVSDNTKNAVCHVTVREATPSGNYTLKILSGNSTAGTDVTGRNLFYGKGKSVNLYAALVSANGTRYPGDVTWSISPNTVATLISSTATACTVQTQSPSDTPAIVKAVSKDGKTVATVSVYCCEINVSKASYEIYKGVRTQISPTVTPKSFPSGVNVSAEKSCTDSSYTSYIKMESNYQFTGLKKTASAYIFRYTLKVGADSVDSVDFLISVTEPEHGLTDKIIEVDDWKGRPASGSSYYSASVTGLSGWLLRFYTLDSDEEVVRKKVKNLSASSSMFTEIELFDLSGGYEDPVTDGFGTCTINMPLDSGWDINTGKVEIYTLDEDDYEKTEKLSCSTFSSSSRPYVRFSTTHFSPFGLAYTKTSTSSSSSSSRSSSSLSSSALSGNRTLDGVPKTGYGQGRGLLPEIWARIMELFQR